MSATVRHIAASDCRLGESPLWRPERQELAFVDIIGKSLLVWNAQTGLRQQPLRQRVGSIAPLPDGDFLAASERGLYRLRATDGALSGLGQDQIIPEHTLMNDGKCDRRGRFVFGSKDVDETAATGALMSFDGTGLRTHAPGCILNGPAFSPAGDRIYFADSPARTIFTARYDLENGSLGAVEVFATVPASGGFPDGMTVDSAGDLWNAQWDGWCVAHYSPAGDLLERIEMPVSRPSSVAFGGADMTTLFVTSAKQGVEGAIMAREPGAGDLFAIKTEARGLHEPHFSGGTDA